MTGEIQKSFQPGGTHFYVKFAYVSDNEIYLAVSESIGLSNPHLKNFSFADTSAVTVIMLGNNSMTFGSIIPTTRDKLVISDVGNNKSDAIMTYHKWGHRDIKVEQLEMPGNEEASSSLFC